MAVDVAASELIEGYRVYAGLLSAVGCTVHQEAVANYLGGDEDQQDEIAELLAGPPGRAGRGEQVPAQVADRMRELTDGLAECFRCVAVQVLADGTVPATPGELTKLLKARPQADKDLIADTALLNGHRKFIRPRYVGAGDIRQVLDQRSDQGQLSMVKLVPFLREELEKRGFGMSESEIRQLFDPSAQDRQAPYCLKRILRGVDGGFTAGLIPLEDMVRDQDPDEWLEQARSKLQFRSHSSMHKAIAEATSLKYDCVHKALSGQKKAKRIQAEISYCLENWLGDHQKGREPAINENYRGVPVEQMHALLPQLEQKFHTKEDIYRLISDSTGIKTGSVRRYFQSDGQLKYAPLAVYRCAKELNADGDHLSNPRSYLVDSRTRRLAQRLAAEANRALRRWQSVGENSELEIAYRELRRALIVTIKEQRRSAPVPL